MLILLNGLMSSPLPDLASHHTAREAAPDGCSTSPDKHESLPGERGFRTAGAGSEPRFRRFALVAARRADQQFGQELGEGIRRMFEEMRLAGLADPLYEQTQGSVRLKLSTEPVDHELEARLPRDTRLLIAALRDAGELSTGEVAEAVGVSRITASERLKKLRDAGLVEWTGKSPKDPRASWRLPST